MHGKKVIISLHYFPASGSTIYHLRKFIPIKVFVQVNLGNNSHCVESVCIRSYSSPHFPALGLNTERYGVSPYSVRRRENADQNNSEYGHFSCSVRVSVRNFLLLCWWVFKQNFNLDTYKSKGRDFSNFIIFVIIGNSLFTWQSIVFVLSQNMPPN